METEPPAVRTWLPSTTRGVTRTSSDSSSRLSGDGVRYKAKLIGLDPVSDSQGEKMCYDSMMKLKGLEEAARKQGRHKLRVWLKICSSGLKILDERTGAILHNQERSKISAVTKDEVDPRALAYIYQHEGSYVLFYLRMANLADPVLLDIREMCQRSVETQPEPVQEPPTQNIPLLPLNEIPAPADEGPAAEIVFSPRPESSSGPSNQMTPSQNELAAVFAIPLEDPLTPIHTEHASPQEPPQPEQQQKPALSTSQILSMFSPHPAASPHYPPSSMPWPQGGAQWGGPAPWPSMPGQPGTMWVPPGVPAPPAGSQTHAAAAALNSSTPTGATGVNLTPNSDFDPFL